MRMTQFIGPGNLVGEAVYIPEKVEEEEIIQIIDSDLYVLISGIQDVVRHSTFVILPFVEHLQTYMSEYKFEKYSVYDGVQLFKITYIGK